MIFILLTLVYITFYYVNNQTVLLVNLELVPNVEAHKGIAHTKIQADDNGVLTVDYHGVQRKVYNPLTVASGGLSYYTDYVKGVDKEQSKNKFISSADWLVKNANNKGEYSLWEYEYPWRFYGWISPPYSSALAQAKGLQVLTLAYELTGNEKYLDVAKKIIRSFLVDYDEGGFVTYEGIGNNSLFLHILAKPNFQKTYVLNGHTQSLLSIWSYYEKTKDPVAKTIFDKGINYLKENLAKYDTGYWSYYDLMENWTMRDYQKGQVQQLKSLYQISKEPILKNYADRFEKYLKYSSLE
ncbi:MAG TPA: D-glucuronyl C5-epimerase family protein [Candidatus Nitrosocosmicus sp.]|nr:D-glucuronyl C5-epimerase family protein [Candidatus Nitrosocosmicus sp.]